MPEASYSGQFCFLFNSVGDEERNTPSIGLGWPRTIAARVTLGLSFFYPLYTNPVSRNSSEVREVLMCDGGTVRNNGVFSSSTTQAKYWTREAIERARPTISTIVMGVPRVTRFLRYLEGQCDVKARLVEEFGLYVFPTIKMHLFLVFDSNQFGPSRVRDVARVRRFLSTVFFVTSQGTHRVELASNSGISDCDCLNMPMDHRVVAVLVVVGVVSWSADTMYKLRSVLCSKLIMKASFHFLRSQFESNSRQAVIVSGLSFVPEYSEYISYTYNNTMSAANSDMKLATMPAPQPKPHLFLDELKVDETRSVIVMIGRVWDVTATTSRYLSKDFVVSDSKDEFRVFKDDMVMLEFDGATIVRKASVSGDGFLRYVLRLVEFDDIELTNNKYFIDVAGYVTNVGRFSYTKGGSKTLEFYLANPKGQSLRVTLWGSVGDSLIEKKTAHPGVCPVVLASMSAKLYNNKLYMSSSSSTLIYVDDDIPILQELKAMTMSDEPNKEVMVVDSSRPREGTIENLLLWARNRKNDPVTFVCNVLIEDVRRKSGWNYPSCGGEKCRKRLSMDNGTFKCGTCGKIVDYPVLRYRLEVVVADDTAHTVVVLFNEMATELVKCSADSIIDALDEGIEDDSELHTLIRNIIGTIHTMEIKSHTYYEHPTYESFNCWRLNLIELANEGTTSNDQLIWADALESSFKWLTKHPTMSTPSKPNETMSKKRSELDDSDTDDASTSVVGSHDMNAKDSRNKKKKKHFDNGMARGIAYGKKE
ncbi:replication protein A 70 kDa DNA-binding subunit C-like protein [Tanacetum coccineum]